MCREGVQGGCAGKGCREDVQGGCAGRGCRESVQGGCAGRVYRGDAEAFVPAGVHLAARRSECCYKAYAM